MSDCSVQLQLGQETLQYLYVHNYAYMYWWQVRMYVYMHLICMDMRVSIRLWAVSSPHWKPLQWSYPPLIMELYTTLLVQFIYDICEASICSHY